MDDKKIVSLYWERSEAAIDESTKKYGRLCHSIAFNILRNNQDSEECVSDTWLRAWNSMPPQRPQKLTAFFCKITRNLSINRLEALTAAKRGGIEAALALDELAEIVSDGKSTADEAEAKMLAELINHFLASLPKKERKIFVMRYWYLYSVRDIADNFGFGESKTKMILLRTRNKLKEYLEKEGVEL